MKTIAIDFDGVIHKYSKGWQAGEIYDESVSGVFEAIGKLFIDGYSVFIFSTRNKHQIKKWLVRQIMDSEYIHDGMGDPNDYIYSKYGYVCKVIPFWKKFWNETNCLGITKRKLPAHAYVDDRAIVFKGDWQQTLLDIEKFKTYQQ